MSLGRYQDIRKDFNYQMQFDATVEEIAIALREAEKLATDDPKLSAFQALKQIVQQRQAFSDAAANLTNCGQLNGWISQKVRVKSSVAFQGGILWLSWPSLAS